MASKRVFDVVVSAVALVLLAPLLAVVAALVAISMGRPVFFRQSRPGLDGELFDIVKFRTMRHGPGSDDERLTRVGAFLRATTLDELPQFLNVLRGDMSLVGPRPLPAIYLDRYTTTQARRHEVRPGLTGLAQVTGRNRLGWTERFELDVDYVDRRSWTLDARILTRTVATVLSGRGVSADGHITMPEFLGTEGSVHGSPVDEKRRSPAAA